MFRQISQPYLCFWDWSSAEQTVFDVISFFPECCSESIRTCETEDVCNDCFYLPVPFTSSHSPFLSYTCAGSSRVNGHICKRAWMVQAVALQPLGAKYQEAI